MKLASAIVAAAVLAAPQAPATGPQAPRAVFGVGWRQRDTSLVRLSALTLRPLSRAAHLGAAGAYLARSPAGGTRAAFAVGENGTAIRFVDLARMRPERRVSLPCAVGGTLWDTADRLVVTCGGAAASIVVVDPVRKRVVARHPLRGSLTHVRAGSGRLVGLLTPLEGIGTARLAVADGAGRVRTVELPGIRAGTEVLDPDACRVHVEDPALAVDPMRPRAAVIPARGPIAVVDLRTLAVGQRVLNARTTATARKNVDGYERDAIWTSRNTIAVTGRNWTSERPDASAPAGLTVIDTSEWTSRDVDDKTSWLGYTGTALVAWGAGLTVYDDAGNRRFHLFGNEHLFLANVAGTYAYLADDTFTTYRIVDTASGSVLATPHRAAPMTIAPMS